MYLGLDAVTSQLVFLLNPTFFIFKYQSFPCPTERGYALFPCIFWLVPVMSFSFFFIYSHFTQVCWAQSCLSEVFRSILRWPKSALLKNIWVLYKWLFFEPAMSVFLTKILSTIFILKPKINIKWTPIRNTECVLLNPEFKEYIAWIVVMFSYDFILIWNSFKCAKSTPLIQSNFGDQLVMSMCRVISCVVGRGCLLRPVHSLGKTLLVCALLHSVLQGKICLLLQVT